MLRINFEGWAKRGALGRRLTIENGQVRYLQGLRKSVSDKESSQNPRGGGTSAQHGRRGRQQGPSGGGCRAVVGRGSE